MANLLSLGKFNKLWFGVSSGLTVEAIRIVGDGVSNLKYKIRAYMRADVQTIHEPHFVILDDIEQENSEKWWKLT